MVTSNFSVHPTFPKWMIPLQIIWISQTFLSFCLPLSLSKSSPLIALNTNLWTFSSLFFFLVIFIKQSEKIKVTISVIFESSRVTKSDDYLYLNIKNLLKLLKKAIFAVHNKYFDL